MKTCSQIITYDLEKENCLFSFIFSGYMIISIQILIYSIIRMTSFRYFQICIQICMCDIQKITHTHTHAKIHLNDEKSSHVVHLKNLCSSLFVTEKFCYSIYWESALTVSYPTQRKLPVSNV